MRGLHIRTAGVAALRLVVAVATATVVVGCTAAVPPPSASAPPITAATTSTPTTGTESAARSTTRATQPPSTVKLAAFAGKWTGHTRSLSVSASGSGHEVVYDGCCTEETDMTFQLSNPRGTSAANARATATLTAVALYAGSGAAPKVGQTGTVTLAGGVLTDAFGNTFCNAAAAARSACGA